MIRFSLACDSGHDFDGWFRNSEDFETQKKRGLVSCPTCHSVKVDKALMAPAVAGARKSEKVALAANEMQRQMMAKLREMAQKVRENADYVGPGFAEEARKIHFGEAEARGIYGEATTEEARALIEDGVEIMPLPVFPEDHH